MAYNQYGKSKAAGVRAHWGLGSDVQSDGTERLVNADAPSEAGPHSMPCPILPCLVSIAQQL